MKTWIVLFVLWPVVVFAQNRPFVFSHKLQESVRGAVFEDIGQTYSVNSDELIRSMFIGDFNGLGQKGMWLRITTTGASADRLVYYDPRTQREQFTVTLKGDEGSNLYQGDFDGDGVLEVIAIRSHIRGPITFENPAFRIFKVSNKRLFQSEYVEFFGLRGIVGNITGDAQDEVILFHYPKPEVYIDGPVDILTLSWNGNGFEQIASVSLPKMSVSMQIADVNNDGREEIVLLQVIWQDIQEIGPVKLAVYSYTGNPGLTLLDEIILPVDLGDEIGLTRLWVQPLTEGGHRIIVPIPEPYYLDREHRPSRILEYRSYCLIENRLVSEPESLNFEWEYYENAPLSLPSSIPQSINGYLQIRDSKRLELVKELPPALPKR